MLNRIESIIESVEGAFCTLSSSFLILFFVLYIFRFDKYFIFPLFAEHRRLTDTQMRLSDNVSTQRQLNDAARFADMDLRAKKIDQRLQVCYMYLSYP